MQPAIELILQRSIHSPLHLHPALSLKGWRDDLYFIMGFAFWTRARMTGMHGAVIPDNQLTRCKKLRQSRTNPL